MKHPNTVASLLAFGLTAGTQWLVQRYAHVGLSDYWKQVVDAGVTGATLYIGRAGLKAAILRVWNGPKTVWAGVTAPSSTK